MLEGAAKHVTDFSSRRLSCCDVRVGRKMCIKMYAWKTVSAQPMFLVSGTDYYIIDGFSRSRRYTTDSGCSSLNEETEAFFCSSAMADDACRKGNRPENGSGCCRDSGFMSTIARIISRISVVPFSEVLLPLLHNACTKVGMA